MNISLQIKNVVDKLFGTILVFVLLVPSLVIMLLIKITSQGPVFYSQERIGLKGKIFNMYKFRSMYTNSQDIRNSDGSTFNSEDDPRVTSIGKLLRKTSLDELPQLINIIKGDMSFIGPRPDLPDQLTMYTNFEKNKLDLKPGISGLAQVNGRNNISWKERMEFDVYYVKNYSLLLDLIILFKTFYTVLKREGINTQKTNS